VAEGDPRSAGQALADDAGIAVVAIAGLDDLLAFAGESAELVVQRERLLEYRARYGCMR
jgi:orotate phosphoribosyltransferase